MPDPGWESFAHGHSCLNYLPSGLLQFTLYGAALEQVPEAAAVTECSGLGNYMHSPISAHYSSFLQTASDASMLPGSIQDIKPFKA